MALSTLRKEFKLLKVTGDSEATTNEGGLVQGKEAATLDDLDRLSGGDINALVVWRKNGDIDFYVPDGNKKVKPVPSLSDLSSPKLTSPKKSMTDHGLPTADITLINGNPKIASINGTLYELEDVPTMV